MQSLAADLDSIYVVPIGKRYMDDLIASEGDNYISLVPGSRSRYYSSDGSIDYDPTGSQFSSADDALGFIGLGHELAHARDDAYGVQLPNLGNYEGPGEPPWERRAMDFERALRDYYGFKSRTWGIHIMEELIVNP
jgi:hypothetical protein